VTQDFADWLDAWLPTLKSAAPEAVLEAIKAPLMPSPEAVKTRTSVPAYLCHRIEQVRYARFQELGYPIGSVAVPPELCSGGPTQNGEREQAGGGGAGEGGENAVGTGNVTPMVALCDVLCSGSCPEAWGKIWQQLVRQLAERRREGRRRRQARRADRATASTEPERKPLVKRLPPEPTKMVDGRLTNNHRWKAGYQQRRARAAARAAKP